MWEEVETSRFGVEIDDKVRMLTQHTGIIGKNTLDKMQQLNKFVKTKNGKVYKEEVYKLKNDMILGDLKNKGKVIQDKGKKNTTYILKQGKNKVEWHLGASYQKFKDQGWIK